MNSIYWVHWFVHIVLNLQNAGLKKFLCYRLPCWKAENIREENNVKFLFWLMLCTKGSLALQYFIHDTFCLHISRLDQCLPSQNYKCKKLMWPWSKKQAFRSTSLHKELLITSWLSLHGLYYNADFTKSQTTEIQSTTGVHRGERKRNFFVLRIMWMLQLYNLVCHMSVHMQWQSCFHFCNRWT